jgi:hypothetical protein
MTDFFSFWESEETVHIPVEAGERFQPTGFIAPVMATCLYQTYSTMDFNDPTFEAPKPFYARKTTNGYFYYYKTQEEALEANKVADNKNSPSLMWTFQVETPKVLNTLDVKKLIGGEDGNRGFGSIISLSAQMTGYRSMMHRHEFHLIALPAAVYAVAKANGYEVPPMDFSALSGKAIYGEPEPGKFGVYINDEFQKDMIGDPEEKDFGVVLKDSVLGRQRVALWAALGEDDPLKYTINETKKVKGEVVPSEYNTAAPKLKACLGIAYNRWPKPIYGRLLMLTDPRVNSGGQGKSQSLPALVEVFKSEAEAKKAAEVDKARMQEAVDRKNGAAVQPAAGQVEIPLEHPPVPAVWAELNTNENPHEGTASWIDMMRSIIADNPEIQAVMGKPKPVVMKTLKKLIDVEKVGGTPEDVEAWLAVVK